MGRRPARTTVHRGQTSSRRLRQRPGRRQRAVVCAKMMISKDDEDRRIELLMQYLFATRESQQDREWPICCKTVRLCTSGCSVESTFAITPLSLHDSFRVA